MPFPYKKFIHQRKSGFTKFPISKIKPKVIILTIWKNSSILYSYVSNNIGTPLTTSHQKLGMCQ